MARITSDDFEKIIKEKNNIHDKVVSTYSVFSKDGEKYFQIDTYGSPERKIVGKCSQSIQIDKEMARELIRILEKEIL